MPYLVQAAITEYYQLDTRKWSEVLVAQSCLTLCDPMNCSLLGSSVHGTLQARILEWVAISFSRGSSQPRDQTQVSCIVADSLPSEPPGKPLINKQVLLTVLEARKSKIKLLTESECLVRRTHFQFIDGSLLAVSSHGRDSERSLWDLLHRDFNPFH